MNREFRLKDRLRSIRFALLGFGFLLTHEHNARIHLAATVAIAFTGLLVGLGRQEWVWLLVAVALVWMAEAFNTAIERLGDAVTSELNPQIGVAKDVAAAGVLAASFAAALIGLIVFVPYVEKLLS